MRVWFLSFLLISVVACGGAGGTDSSVTTPPVVTSTAEALPTTLESSTTTTVETTTTIAPDAVPSELVGTWITTLDTGYEVTLILGRTFFTLDREDLEVRSSGKVSVVGDSIEFSLGEFCQGTGSYTFVLEGEMLTFALQGIDECGRSQVLDGFTYTLVAPPG